MAAIKQLRNEDFPIELIEDLGYIHLSETSKQPRRMAMFKCNCGDIFRGQPYQVKKGSTCRKCSYIKTGKALSRPESKTRSPLYGSWMNMLKRVDKPAQESYKDLNLTVEESWRDFDEFKLWAYSNGFESGLSIHRIDNDKGYHPGNCKWSTRTEQMHIISTIRSNNTTGYKGVSYSSRDKIYAVHIGNNGVRVRLGTYSDVVEAAKAYDSYVHIHNLDHTNNELPLYSDIRRK